MAGHLLDGLPIYPTATCEVSRVHMDLS